MTDEFDTDTSVKKVDSEWITETPRCLTSVELRLNLKALGHHGWLGLSRCPICARRGDKVLRFLCHPQISLYDAYWITSCMEIAQRLPIEVNVTSKTYRILPRDADAELWEVAVLLKKFQEKEKSPADRISYLEKANKRLRRELRDLISRVNNINNALELRRELLKDETVEEPIKQYNAVAKRAEAILRQRGSKAGSE